eukprot:COSAG01_NODE_13340_length_1598_cov_12.995997_3_plen_199_part_00
MPPTKQQPMPRELTYADSACSDCAMELCTLRIAELRRLERDYKTLALFDEAVAGADAAVASPAGGRGDGPSFWISKKWVAELKAKSKTKSTQTISKDVKEWIDWTRKKTGTPQERAEQDKCVIHGCLFVCTPLLAASTSYSLSLTLSNLAGGLISHCFRPVTWTFNVAVGTWAQTKACVVRSLRMRGNTSRQLLRCAE